MPKYADVIMLALAAVLVAGCQSGIPKSAQRRTSAEMRQAIGTDGLTAWGHDTKGNDWVSYTAPNGTVVVKSGTFTDQGAWHIDPGGKFCLKWHKIRNGAETCMTQYVAGNDIYNVLPDGSVVSVQTRQAPGNPDHL
ncbi:MAG TPA: hypothetical protein VMU81_08605 [Acetobacteraceae bacterium]|jgi:hypothetical protein|nr:hypothetical protein [Acetobacteraceae bacterium]